MCSGHEVFFTFVNIFDKFGLYFRSCQPVCCNNLLYYFKTITKIHHRKKVLDIVFCYFLIPVACNKIKIVFGVIST